MARLGLSQFKNLTGNEFKSIFVQYSISDILNLGRVICINSQITSVESLRELLNLKYLDLRDTIIISLEGIEKLINLTTLYCSIPDIRRINVKIKWLINPFKCIEKLINLTSLDLSYSSIINNFKGIENLTNLQYLNCSNITDTSFEGIEESNKFDIFRFELYKYTKP